MNIGKYSKLLLDYEPQHEKRVIMSNDDEKLRILRIICQRPYFTGSGINLINLTKQSLNSEIEQFIIFGQPNGEKNPLEGIIPLENTISVNFQSDQTTNDADIDFPITGMSDQMPYKSTKFSEFTMDMLESYLKGFALKIKKVVEDFKPHLIHTHHLWLVSALTRSLYPDIPIVTTCHNTALRQVVLASQLKRFVINPIKHLDKIAVINEDQRERVKITYEFSDSIDANGRFFYIGQGINTDIFYPTESNENDEKDITKKIIYVGKLCFSKGVPQLLQVFDEISDELPFPCELKLAGSGDGAEKDVILEMVRSQENRVQFLGQLTQGELAKCFRESDLFVLPSFYDGFPKVLLESLACGCKAIITDLPGIKDALKETIGLIDNVLFIPMPSMKSIDEPEIGDLPKFKINLKEAIKTHLTNTPRNQVDFEFANKIKKEYGWHDLFTKYLATYNSLLKI